MNTESNNRYTEPMHNKAQPFEYYRFNFSKVEVEKISKSYIMPTLAKMIIFFIVYSILLVMAFSVDAKSWAVGFVVGVMFYAIVMFYKGIRLNKRNMLMNTERIPQCTYDYKIYSDFLTVEIYKNGEMTYYSKIYFSDIEQVFDTGEHFCLVAKGQMHIIRKADLIHNSVIHQFINSNPNKLKNTSLKNSLNFIANTVFLLSLLSLCFGFYLVSQTASGFEIFPDTTWIFFLLTPVPIASIVLGFVLKAKGQKFLRNIIAGFIVLVLMCFCGSSYYIFTAVFEDVSENFTENTSSLSFYESELDIDIPKYDTIVTQDWTTASQSGSDKYIYSTIDLTFEEDVAEEFSTQISEDSRWIESVPDEMTDLVTNLYSEKTHKYLMIYNYDTEEYNVAPENNSTYYFIALFFSPEHNTLKIVEYDVEYIKDGTSFNI